MDYAVQFIQATVQIEQPMAAGSRSVGTAFLLSAVSPDGSPRTLLVTANHVFAGMPGAQATLGYRMESADGSWRYTPQALAIRDAAGAPLWARHPTRDVAVLSVKAPPEFARAAIPLNYLAADDMAGDALRPGEELMVLGFPRGLAANTAGFPILRAGRVSSYPLTPKTYPTFLLDFSVFPGNSGGPVFLSPREVAAGASAKPVIAGLLTQQVELNHERLEIGIVTHARYVSETIALLDYAKSPVTMIANDSAPVGARPASDITRSPSIIETWIQAAAHAVIRMRVAVLKSWGALESRSLNIFSVATGQRLPSHSHA